MKRKFERIFRAALFLAITFFILSGKSITTRAIEYDKIKEVKLIDEKYTSEYNFIDVYYKNEDAYISDVRTSSKYLKAGLIDMDRTISEQKNESIQLIGTKKGTYWVYFDLKNSAGNYLSTERTKVIVCSEKDSYKAFKRIKIGKVDILKHLFKDDYKTKDVTLRRGGKIKVKMRKGYKLLDISVRRTIAFDMPSTNPKRHKDNTLEVQENIKNGSVVKLSEVGEEYLFFRDNITQKLQYNDSIFGYTYVTLTYRDKRGNERKNTITLRNKVK